MTQMKAEQHSRKDKAADVAGLVYGFTTPAETYKTQDSQDHSGLGFHVFLLTGPGSGMKTTSDAFMAGIVNEMEKGGPAVLFFLVCITSPYLCR